jgi:hypothetical protein
MFVLRDAKVGYEMTWEQSSYIGKLDARNCGYQIECQDCVIKWVVGVRFIYEYAI